MIDASRSGLKRLAERVVVALGGPILSRALRRDSDVVLAYHNIVPSGGERGGDRSLHLSRDEFARQLDSLCDTHRVIPLAELFAPKPTERGSGPRAVLTFDDGYRGALTAGMEELVARGLPATFFVSPGLLGRDALWWDALVPRTGPMPESFRRMALEEACGREDEVYDLADDEGMERRPQPWHAGVATLDELRDATRRPGMRVGSHTWRHPNLARVENRELEEELVRPLRWLRGHFGDDAIPWLSLPYGRSGPRVEQVAREAGYRGLLRVTERGMVGGNTDPNAVPRRNVPAGLSIDGFRLLTSGL